jgi:DNA-binding response OmpR family regulator
VGQRSISSTLQTPFKALIATDDDALTSVEHSALEQLHFEAVTAHDDGEMLHSIREEKPDLVILDAALPGAGGLEACRKLREDPDTAGIPIIMVTAPDNITQKIKALETGADDCVTKPVQVEVLIAHIKALARRTLPDLSSNRLRAGPIDMDLDRWTVSIAGTPVDLTKKEFRLLQVLLEAKGRALTRDFLLQKAWSHATIHGLDTRTVDVHIGRLRRKLGNAGQYIITVRNVGFRFDVLPEWITGNNSP